MTFVQRHFVPYRKQKSANEHFLSLSLCVTGSGRSNQAQPSFAHGQTLNPSLLADRLGMHVFTWFLFPLLLYTGKGFYTASKQAHHQHSVKDRSQSFFYLLVLAFHFYFYYKCTCFVFKGFFKHVPWLNIWIFFYFIQATLNRPEPCGVTSN